MLEFSAKRLAQAGPAALRGQAMPLAPKFAGDLRAARPTQAFRARRHVLIVAVASRPQKAIEQPQVAVLQEDPTLFFDPLLRSFILGLGAGALFETLHVATKMYDLWSEVGYDQLVEMWPRVQEHFSPLFVDDHVVAICSWVFFYIVEAVAIYAVLKQHPDDMEAAGRNIRDKVTLAKKLMPLPLQFFKQALLKGQVTTSSATTAVLEPPMAAPKTLPRLGGGVRSSIVNAPPSISIPSAPRRQILSPHWPQDPRKTPPRRDDEEGKQGPTLAERRAQKGLQPGQLDPASSDFAHRVKELQGRRSYLTNFWYAAGISETIKDKPVGVEILGEKVVLFRGADGQVHCLNDVCPHRGAPLHQGWVDTSGGHDCVVCPYHGWKLDSKGVLRDVPAAENPNEFPQKPMIDVYPVQEKGGFVWLFYGSRAMPEDERPPIPFVPELEDPSWRPVYGEIEFECNHWSVFENAIDMAHIHYLHNDTFGNQGMPQIRGMTCTHDAYGVLADFRLHNKPVKGWEFAKVPEVHVTARALLPSTSVIAFTLGNGLSFTTFVNTVPINGDRTVNRFTLIRKLDVDRIGTRVFNMAAWDRFARQAMLRRVAFFYIGILSEDKAMVEQLRPELLGREISVKADLPQIAFRKLRSKYLAWGYGIAPECASEGFRADY